MMRSSTPILPTAHVRVRSHRSHNEIKVLLIRSRGLEGKTHCSQEHGPWGVYTPVREQGLFEIPHRLPKTDPRVVCLCPEFQTSPSIRILACTDYLRLARIADHQISQDRYGMTPRKWSWRKRDEVTYLVNRRLGQHQQRPVTSD